MKSDSMSQGIDASTPNIARMYDYFLGGKDNFAVDRQTAEKVLKLIPDARSWVRANRDFLIRAVQFLAEAGIRQFIDIGTGLPTQQNVHEVAQGVAPDSRVVYVDIDPVVVTHGRAILASDQNSKVIAADMRRPDDIIFHPEVCGSIDFDRPVALLLVAILHFIDDDEEAAQIVLRLSRPLAVGSYLIISHATPGDLSQSVLRKGREIYAAASPESINPRTPQQVEAFFDSLELVDPGVVNVTAWPAGEEGKDFSRPGFIGVVGRKGHSPTGG